MGKKKKHHIDKATFKQIFTDHWKAFKNRHSRYDNEYYDEIINKMLDCGDSEKMGYARYTCFNCGTSHSVAMTCKSCFCLSCSVPYADKWVDFIGRRLLPGVVYRHIVLTVPDFLGFISTATASC